MGAQVVQTGGREVGRVQGEMKAAQGKGWREGVPQNSQMLPPPQVCCPGDESVVVLHTNSTQEQGREEGL